jgi:hypothetical protein
MSKKEVASPLVENRARVLAVISAIATGIGVIGLMTLVGGAVLWIRFDKFEIPADKAVAVIPKGELVVIGLSTLLPYVALALALVFVAFLFAADNVVPTAPATDVRTRWAGRSPAPEPPSGPTPEWNAQLSPSALEAIAAAETIDQAADDAAAAARFGSESLAKGHSDRAADALERMRSLVARSEGSLRDAGLNPVKLLEAAERSRERAKKQVDKARDRRLGTVTRVIVAGAVLVVLEMVMAVWRGIPFVWWHFILLLLLAVVLAGAVVVVGWRTQGFALFGASLFLAVLVFGSARTLGRAWDRPKLQPIAVLRTGADPGIIGYYIAGTSDRVYLAKLAEEVPPGQPSREPAPPKLARIIAVPRSSVVGLAIGPLSDRKAGLQHAKELLNELCASKVAEESKGTASATKPATSNGPCPPAA